VTQVLLAGGADPTRCRNRSITPLHDAAEAGAHAICRDLLTGGADPNAIDADGCTPLSVASRSWSTKQGAATMRHLLMAGASPFLPLSHHDDRTLAEIGLAKAEGRTEDAAWADTAGLLPVMARHPDLPPHMADRLRCYAVRRIASHPTIAADLLTALGRQVDDTGTPHD
jgi:ankyrin repeat protein